MYIKQISIFIGNKRGRLADITRILENESIDIRALSIADTTDFGVLRLIVDDPDRAKSVLKNANYTVISTDVIGVEVNDAPGGFSRTVSILSDAEIDLEYAYAFLSRQPGKACVILRVSDNEAAVKLFNDNKVRILSSDEVFPTDARF